MKEISGNTRLFGILAGTEQGYSASLAMDAFRGRRRPGQRSPSCSLA